MKSKINLSSFIEAYPDLSLGASDIPEGEELSVTDVIVRAAILELGETERRVVHLRFYEGLDVSDIASELGKKEQTVKNALDRAMKTVREKIQDSRWAMGITNEFNLCPICNHSECDQINQALHLWLDSKGWETHGILKMLSSQFGDLRIDTVPEVMAHVKLHMGVDMDDVPISSRKSKEPLDENSTWVSIRVPNDVKAKIEELSEKYDTTCMTFYRWSLRAGVIVLTRMLTMNEDLSKIQYELLTLIRRLKF